MNNCNNSCELCSFPIEYACQDCQTSYKQLMSEAMETAEPVRRTFIGSGEGANIWSEEGVYG